MKQTNKTASTQASKASANTPVSASFETYVSKVDDVKKANALKEVHAKAQTKKAGTVPATKQTVFGIVANVSFNIPRILSGAFNAFHKSKGRLEWHGKIGKITASGAQYFTQREGAVDEKAYKLFVDQCSQAKYPLKEVDGIQWPVNPQGIKWIPGQGTIGQSAFFYALCRLTQGAAKAK